LRLSTSHFQNSRRLGNLRDGGRKFNRAAAHVWEYRESVVLRIARSHTIKIKSDSQIEEALGSVSLFGLAAIPAFASQAGGVAGINFQESN
jgi:hypothetical protein